MKRLCLFFLIAVAVHAKCPSSGQRKEPLSRVYVPTKMSSVVQIQTDCGSCTGWIAGKNTFVTAAHCFGHAYTKIQAVFVDGQKRALTLAWLGDEHTPIQDTAILTGDTRGITPLAVEDKEPPVGIMCVAIGYGEEHWQKASPCVVGPTALESLITFLYKMQGDVDFGDSGGPVLDKDGRVVGEVILKAGDKESTFFIIPGVVLRQRLSEHGGH